MRAPKSKNIKVAETLDQLTCADVQHMQDLLHLLDRVK